MKLTIKTVRYEGFRAAVAVNTDGQCVGWRRLQPGKVQPQVKAFRAELERR